ncbi:MAG: type II toxin-antitoxin system HicB family antitoxin [Caldilinea sp. CFX5]|nr:type II toxin-antitoxin system HicB family antitoxin [Caldilinea sp. CFX5]
MTSKITVVIEKDDDGYYAYAPELAGCQTQGETLDETLTNIREAVELYLSTMTVEEFSAITNKAILTTTLEVALA